MHTRRLAAQGYQGPALRVRAGLWMTLQELHQKQPLTPQPPLHEGGEQPLLNRKKAEQQNSRTASLHALEGINSRGQ